VLRSEQQCSPRPGLAARPPCKPQSLELRQIRSLVELQQVPGLDELQQLNDLVELRQLDQVNAGELRLATSVDPLKKKGSG
jgi:hypothetical protein